MDSWEEGFDIWTPGTPREAGEADAGEDTGTDLDRAELLRLARELAERRQAPQTGADAEIEQLKRALRERAEAIAARERELAELQRRLERDRPSVRSLLELRPKQNLFYCGCCRVGGGIDELDEFVAQRRSTAAGFIGGRTLH